MKRRGGGAWWRCMVERGAEIRTCGMRWRGESDPEGRQGRWAVEDGAGAAAAARERSERQPARGRGDHGDALAAAALHQFRLLPLRYGLRGWSGHRACATCLATVVVAAVLPASRRHGCQLRRSPLRDWIVLFSRYRKLFYFCFVGTQGPIALGANSQYI